MPAKRSNRPQGYVSGDFKRRCDRSGRICLASDMRKEWTGMWVHKDLWEERHPQDFVRGRADDQVVSEARPDEVHSTLLKSATGSGTSSSATIALVTADIGSTKTTSRLVLTLTMTDYNDRRLKLHLSHSTDGATYTDITDPLSRDTLDSSLTATAFSVVVPENTQYWKCELRNNSGSVTYTASLDVYGGDVLSVTAGSL